MHQKHGSSMLTECKICRAKHPPRQCRGQQAAQPQPKCTWKSSRCQISCDLPAERQLSVGRYEPFRKITFHRSCGPGSSWLPTSWETGQTTPEERKKQQQVTSKTGPHCSSVGVCQTGEDTALQQLSRTSGVADSWGSCPHILSLFSYTNLASPCVFD